ANRILLALADSVTSHMRKDGVKAYCVAVKIRYLDFKTRSHQRKLSEATDVSGEVHKVARELLKELWNDKRPLRLMGIALTDLSDESEPVQMTMFREEEQINREKGQKLDKAVDSLRNKFGSGIITRTPPFTVIFCIFFLLS
nr:DNA polymerase IV [Lachnospiraceae bacterium]